MTWKSADPDEAMRARMKDEITAIRSHMGAEAPSIDTEIIEVWRNKDDELRFIMPGEAYTLTPSGVAVRYRSSRDGREDVTYWRHGVKVDHIHNPPPAESN